MRCSVHTLHWRTGGGRFRQASHEALPIRTGVWASGYRLQQCSPSARYLASACLVERRITARRCSVPRLESQGCQPSTADGVDHRLS